jgi:hypothetical protein
MKKLLLLLLLLPYFAIAQVSNGREFEAEAIKTTGSQTITNPVYLVTEGVDGTHGKTTATALEKTSNKSTFQTGDGTGSQYLTKDATAGAFNEFAESTLSTGAISNLSKVEMIATSTTNLKIRGTYAVEGVPDNYSPMYFASNLPTDGTFIIPNFLKSFDSFNYPLSQLETPTGNNEVSGVLVNTDKTYVKFLGLKFNGGIITGDTDFKGNKSVASLGYIVVVRTAGVITFKFSPSSESVVNQVLIAGNTSLARDNTTLTTDVGVSFSTTTTAFNSITGNLYGMSINWHTNNNTVNPNNGNSINTKAVIGVTNQPFSAATPTSFNSTSPALLNTTFDGNVSSTEAIAIKTAYFNTTTQLTTAATGNVFLLYRLMITQGGRWFWQIESAPNNGALSTTITDAKTKALTYVWDDAILPKGVWIKMGTLVISRNYTNFNPANSNDFAWFPSGAGGGGSSAVQIIGDATETVKGVVQLATPAETTAGTDNTKAVHPLGLKSALDAKIGVGTTNTVSKFSAGQLVDSNISDTGSSIVLGVAGASNTTQINGLTTIKGTVASDTAPLGAELLTTASGTNWTGTGWATGYTHTAGSTAVLTGVDAIANATYYQTVITITGRTAGTVTVTFGGYSSGAISSSLTVGPLTTSTAGLVVTPTNDFDGTVRISIKSIGISSANISFIRSNGIMGLEIRVPITTENAVFGGNSGLRLTTGNRVSLFGSEAGRNITTGSNSVLVGVKAGLNITTGGFNTIVGSDALSISNADYTTSLGYQALANLIISNLNTAIGFQAGRRFGSGTSPLTNSSTSIFIGNDARAGGDGQSNQTVIGSGAIGLGSNTNVLGNSTSSQTHLWGNLTLGNTVNDGLNLLQVAGSTIASQYKISALNTAPSSATASGTLGEIRITATHIFVCTATNTWVRTALTTW